MLSGGLFGRLFSDDGVPEGYLIMLCPFGTGIPRGTFSVDRLVTTTVEGEGIADPFPFFSGAGNCLERRRQTFYFY